MVHRQTTSPKPLTALQRLISKFLPPACAGCDGHTTPARAFCEVCSPVASTLDPPYCAICRTPIQQFSTSADSESECSRCRRRPPSFEQLRARWIYDGAVADAIRRLKYGQDFASLRALCRGARGWFQSQLAEFPKSTPLIPIPSHLEALRRRGFHVPTMALHLLGGRKYRRRICHRLKKTRSTPRQASLPLAARRDNVRRVFADCGLANAEGTAILFDDVVTTGATVDSAAGVLLKAGFETVHVLTLARAPDPRSAYAQRRFHRD